nr:hypothetical protein [Tanacetum cinerariifolium]
ELPSHLEYVFLEGTDKLPVIIAKDLKDAEKERLIKVLKSHKHAIAWKLSDIKDGFSWYFQISIDPQDQERTTFTCPYGTFAYRCTLPSNTIPNPKGEMKAITTRSGVAYEGPSIPTPKKVVERETKETTDKEPTNFQGSAAQIQPPVTLIPKLDVPKTLPKPNIPYPSRLNDQRLHEKATNKMDNDAPKKLPKKLGDPGKFLIPCDFSRMDEILGFYNNTSGGNLTLTSEPILSDSSLSLTPFEGSDFILEEIKAYLKDESISLKINHVDCDLEGDICLIEKLLNNDPFQLPPMDLKQREVVKAKFQLKSL